jgi:hypothetical protein
VSIANDSAFACARNASTGKSKPPAVAPISRAASRLVIISIVGRLIRSRQLAHPSGLPSISLSSRWLDSVKRQWRLAQTPYNSYMPV